MYYTYVRMYVYKYCLHTCTLDVCSQVDVASLQAKLESVARNCEEQLVFQKEQITKKLEEMWLNRIKCVRVCVRACVRVCAYVHAYVCVQACVRTCVCMRACMHTCMCVLIYVADAYLIVDANMYTKCIRAHVHS